MLFLDSGCCSITLSAFVIYLEFLCFKSKELLIIDNLGSGSMNVYGYFEHTSFTALSELIYSTLQAM